MKIAVVVVSEEPNFLQTITTKLVVFIRAVLPEATAVAKAVQHPDRQSLGILEHGLVIRLAAAAHERRMNDFDVKAVAPAIGHDCAAFPGRAVDEQA